MSIVLGNGDGLNNLSRYHNFRTYNESESVAQNNYNTIAGWAQYYTTNYSVIGDTTGSGRVRDGGNSNYAYKFIERPNGLMDQHNTWQEFLKMQWTNKKLHSGTDDEFLKFNATFSSNESNNNSNRIETELEHRIESPDWSQFTAIDTSNGTVDTTSMAYRSHSYLPSASTYAIMTPSYRTGQLNPTRGHENKTTYPNLTENNTDIYDLNISAPRYSNLSSGGFHQMYQVNLYDPSTACLYIYENDNAGNSTTLEGFCFGTIAQYISHAQVAIPTGYNLLDTTLYRSTKFIQIGGWVEKNTKLPLDFAINPSDGSQYDLGDLYGGWSSQEYEIKTINFGNHLELLVKIVTLNYTKNSLVNDNVLEEDDTYAGEVTSSTPRVNEYQLYPSSLVPLQY